MQQDSQHWHRILEQYLVEYLEQCEPTGLLNIVVSDVEKLVIGMVLEHCNNSQTMAAKKLGISRSSLIRKLGK